MENPYEGNYYQPYTPQSQPTPVPPVYNGNQTMASLSLVMGILALLSLCCMPFLLFIFAGLAILFSCLSKGQYARSGPAKAGMAIGISCITLATVLIITICTLFLVTDQGRSFMQDYFSIITSEDLTEEELYDFLNKYLYGGEDSMDDYNSYDNYDDYDDFENYEEFFEDELPYYYQQPEGETGDSGEGNFI